MTAKEDLKHQRVSVLIHVLMGLIVGIVSPVFGSGYYALAFVIFGAILLGHGVQKLVGNRGFSWWIGNGLFIYLLVWVDVWVFIANYF
jgi:hypothetical protein